MNERIRLLAEQATTYIEPTSNSGEGWIFDKEKFAELIVKECNRYACSAWEHGPLLGRDLLIHFGIVRLNDEQTN
jgi:hypothetical protein